MTLLWDYDKKTLSKTSRGRRILLERMINYGPGKGKKIPLKEVKKQWNFLHLNSGARRLMELLIWGKYRSSPKTSKRFYIS
jgi:hypothetical protein